MIKITFQTEGEPTESVEFHPLEDQHPDDKRDVPVQQAAQFLLDLLRKPEHDIIHSIEATLEQERLLKLTVGMDGQPYPLHFNNPSHGA